MTAISPPRVVSLIASATEIVHALGAGDQQIARSHECDWPERIMGLPALTKAKFKVEGSSRQIDTAVKSLVEQGLAVYEVNADALRDLAPDVILTQDQCEVCAVSLADVERAVQGWTECKANVVSLRPHTIADIYADNQRIADALGRASAGAQLNARMATQFSEVAARVAGRERPQVAFIEWIDPPMSGGHWMPELIAIAGGINLFGEHGAQSPWISLDEVAAADPDVILVAPCGYDIAKTQSEMGVLDTNPRWRDLRAVREGRLFVADGNAFFNRPGPRLVESAQILAEILHPDTQGYGHMGQNVVRHRPIGA
ncbi:MAG TPA: cobalamin-binding protein [Hyphomicrobium sp.]|nr:cobalamin-binding protein [Hyphomicrobium sp.]